MLKILQQFLKTYKIKYKSHDAYLIFRYKGKRYCYDDTTQMIYHPVKMKLETIVNLIYNEQNI